MAEQKAQNEATIDDSKQSETKEHSNSLKNKDRAFHQNLEKAKSNFLRDISFLEKLIILPKREECVKIEEMESEKEGESSQENKRDSWELFDDKSCSKSDENFKNKVAFDHSLITGLNKEFQEYSKLEKTVQKYEGDIRELIRSEHQLRLLAESLQEHIEDMENNHEAQLKKMKETILVASPQLLWR